MKKKLTLREIVPYLPYGLKAKLSQEGVFNLDSEYRNEYAYRICTITDFTTYSKDLGGSIKVDKTKDYRFDFDSLSEIEIILRPLSDLIKEIEVNGEKFVPLQKLCRLFAYNEQYKKDWIFNSEENYAFNGGSNRNNFNKDLIYFCSASDPITNREFGYYSISKKFYLKNNRDKEDLTYVVNQYDAMQKLFEWHFDVFGLIEAGLAIDINTLSE